MVTRTRDAHEIAPTPPAKAKVNVLLVDDDATKRFALRTILAPLDENVVEASSGADALRQLLRNEFAVVLLDVRMPIMDGFETAQLIRQRPRSELTPIIFVTALDQAETDMGRGYNLGAVDFVFAPVVPAIMRAKVSVFVELYRAQQELRRYRTQLETLVEERTIALTAQIVQEQQAEYPDRKVEVDIAPGITVNADKRLVRILLSNLINNSLKFTGGNKSPRITVGREMVDGESRVFVRDDGVGFDMIDSHRLFGAFQRLHSQSDFPGAGIGLATARRIVNRHGGRIWAEGAVGEGATFYFVL